MPLFDLPYHCLAIRQRVLYINPSSANVYESLLLPSKFVISSFRKYGREQGRKRSIFTCFKLGNVSRILMCRVRDHKNKLGYKMHIQTLFLTLVLLWKLIRCWNLSPHLIIYALLFWFIDENAAVRVLSLPNTKFRCVVIAAEETFLELSTISLPLPFCWSKDQALQRFLFHVK